MDVSDTFGFVSNTCSKLKKSDCVMCENCLASAKRFYRRIDAANEIRSQENVSLKTKKSLVDLSPGMLRNQLNFVMDERRTEQKLKSIAKIKLERMKNGNGGDILALGENSFRPELLFDDELLELRKKHFGDNNQDNNGVSDSALSKYIFKECILQTRRAAKSGKKSCRYSFLMIRLAISLKLKLGKGRYDFLAKCLNLPSDSHLTTYKSHSVGAPDGILHDSLEAERFLFENLDGKDVPIDDWRRHGQIAWDSITIKEKLYFCPNTMRVVGYAEDAFDLNIIKSELKERLADQKEKNGKEKEDTTIRNTGPPLATYFLCFIFTSWEKRGKRIQIVISRYGVLSLDATFIYDKILSAIVACARFGFIANTLGCDRAAENRSALKTLGTLTVEDILSEKIRNLPGSGNILNEIPTKVKIAFRHPIYPNIIIFIGSDSPHLGKKIVNAFERSGDPKNTKSLYFEGQPIQLKMLRHLWEASSDDIVGDNSLSIYRKFTRDHFEKIHSIE